MDENGNFWVTGRIHNLINTGGEKVAPEEVERVLSEFPGVRDCTVVGIPDERWGEAIAAALILEKETPVPDLPALHSFAKGRIASYKLPKFIVPVPEFPIGANGKVDRLALAKLLSAASLQAQL
ncbi:AMP-binding enzyme [Arcanobacterium hippocoleae]